MDFWNELSKWELLVGMIFIFILIQLFLWKRRSGKALKEKENFLEKRELLSSDIEKLQRTLEEERAKSQKFLVSYQELESESHGSRSEIAKLKKKIDGLNAEIRDLKSQKKALEDLFYLRIQEARTPPPSISSETENSTISLDEIAEEVDQNL